MHWKKILTTRTRRTAGDTKELGQKRQYNGLWGIQRNWGWASSTGASINASGTVSFGYFQAGAVHVSWRSVIKDELARPYHLILLNIKPILAGVKAVLVEPAVPHLKLVVPHHRVKLDVPHLTVKLSVHSLNVSLVRGRHRAVVDTHLDLLTKGLALTLSQKSQKTAQLGRRYRHYLH